MTLPPLHAEHELILRTLAGSTTHRAAEAAADYARMLQARAGRVEAGRRSAQLRVYHRQEAAIVHAAGLMQPDEPYWVELVAGRIEKRGDHYGLKQMPSHVRIGETLERLKKTALHGTVHCSTTFSST